MWRRYNELLHTRPLPTKCITSAILYMLGDGAGQYLDGTLQRQGYQPRRTLSAGIFGGLVFAPIAHGNTKCVICYNTDHFVLSLPFLPMLSICILYLHFLSFCHDIGWYNGILNRLLPGTTTGPVLGKAALDQTLFVRFALSLSQTHAAHDIVWLSVSF